jgi:hypothetical protein
MHCINCPFAALRKSAQPGQAVRGAAVWLEKGNHMTDIENAPHEEAAAEELARYAGRPDDAAKYGVEGCCYRTFWAVVERDGTLVRGRNVARVARLTDGQYEIVFTSDVSNGVYVASIGRPGIATEPAGEIGVALRCCLSGHETDKGVWVDTHDSNGRYADRAFHLVVHTQ